MKPRHNYNADMTTIECELVTTTAAAICVSNEKGDDTWLPRSQIKNFTDNEDGTCSFDCSEELATEKELV